MCVNFVCRVALVLTTVQYSVSEGVARGTVNNVAIKFDGHPVITLEKLAAVFPHQSQLLAEERTKVKQKLERQTNSIV